MFHIHAPATSDGNCRNKQTFCGRRPKSSSRRDISGAPWITSSWLRDSNYIYFIFEPRSRIVGLYTGFSISSIFFFFFLLFYSLMSVLVWSERKLNFCRLCLTSSGNCYKSWRPVRQAKTHLVCRCITFLQLNYVKCRAVFPHQLSFDHEISSKKI